MQHISNEITLLQFQILCHTLQSSNFPRKDGTFLITCTRHCLY